ncbi:PEPxxWA-CTERM sorting domain-containing protein [Phenylobacterium sp.]|uniref:PEPxxWA-CTERM sorting domain-containing protein n=1 Tax=Phenylobacterium sp. TaxID=1871053 RepID=UPI00120C79D0|nr:PEPxxWA-CTERM sorting domain-containing protein [Phenylobacterium sp.]THD50683.1 MAG: PEP-CTERM sorting domain-containing protein [Phenylobacterium sp.]
MRNFLIAAALAVSTVGLAAGQASAQSITYTITGVGDGDLAGTDFTNAAYTITMHGDLANIVNSGFQALDPLSSSDVDIDGIGDVTLDVATRMGIYGSVGFFSRSDSIGGLDLLDFQLPHPVNLTTAFGPLLGTDISAISQFSNVQSSGGALTFTSSSNVEFSSVLGGGGVPEPATWALVLTGFAAAGAGLRAARRRRPSFA